MIFHFAYYQAKYAELRRVYKREFYAMSYGNYRAQLVCKDAIAAYNMGGEL